jgi:hypothetical protein
MMRGKELSLDPTPRVGRLDTLTAVRRELAKVYKDARTGKLDPQDGTRLGFLLVSLAKLIESSDLEARIAALEQRTKEKDT